MRAKFKTSVVGNLKMLQTFKRGQGTRTLRVYYNAIYALFAPRTDLLGEILLSCCQIYAFLHSQVNLPLFSRGKYIKPAIKCDNCSIYNLLKNKYQTHQFCFIPSENNLLLHGDALYLCVLLKGYGFCVNMLAAMVFPRCVWQQGCDRLLLLSNVISSGVEWMFSWLSFVDRGDNNKMWDSLLTAGTFLHNVNSHTFILLLLCTLNELLVEKCSLRP